MAGVCMAGGMARDALHGGSVWREAFVAAETATTADGTHPTGMHSCFQLISHYLKQ